MGARHAGRRRFSQHRGNDSHKKYTVKLDLSRAPRKAQERFLVSGNDDLEDDAHQENDRKRRNYSFPMSSLLHFSMHDSTTWLLDEQGHLLSKWEALDSLLCKIIDEGQKSELEKSVLFVCNETRAIETLQSIQPKKTNQVYNRSCKRRELSLRVRYKRACPSIERSG